MKTNFFRTNKKLFGILILTLMLVSVAVSQATGILKLENLNFFGNRSDAVQTGRKVSVQPKYRRQATPIAAPQPAGPATAGNIPAPISSHVTVVDLINESETIVSGEVLSVTDGIENKVPFTEVKLRVQESFRGNAGEELTFRQFGLTKPRRMENGRVSLNVTPDGWAKYKAGEQVMLFLYKTASLTGLRAPVGLSQGKFDLQAANIINQTGNIGLFEGVELDANLTNERDARLLATPKGPVNADSFMSFVRRAVNNKWIEGGKLKNANQ